MPTNYFNNPQLRQGFEDTRRRGNMAEEAYLTGALSYNPMQALTDSTTGAFNQFRRQLNLDIEGLRGSQVGMGRLNTGFATEDEDRLVGDSVARLNDEIRRNAFQAEQLKFANMQGLGAYGAGKSEMALQGTADLEAGDRDRKDLEKERKRSFWGGIIKGGLSAAGMALAFSDETLKEDIKDGDPVLPRVRRITAKTWNWNDEGQKLTGDSKKKRRSGVLAQDVRREFPEMVDDTDKSGKLRVDYGGLTSTLVTAIGELDEKIDRIGGRAASAFARG